MDYRVVPSSCWCWNGCRNTVPNSWRTGTYVRTDTVSQENSAAGLIPPVQSGMPWRVAAVEVLADFRFKVRFLDGTEGVVNMESLVHSGDAGVFAVLANQERFAEAYVELGAVTWSDELDLAPDSMYRSIKAHGAHTVGATKREMD